MHLVQAQRRAVPCRPQDRCGILTILTVQILYILSSSLGRKRMYLRPKILPKCHLTTLCIWQEVPEKLDLFWAQHCANGVVQLLACKSHPASSEHGQTASLCLQTTKVPLSGSKGITFLIRISSSCSGKGLIIIWFLPLHSPTKFSFSPQNRSVSVDTLNSLHLAHAQAVLMQGHGFTEPGLVTRVRMHPEHRGLTSTVQITGTHFWARSPRQYLGSNTYGWTLFETVTNCQETCNKNIFRATEWLRVPKLSKREESIQTRKQFLFSSLLFHQDLNMSQGMQEWGKALVMLDITDSTSSITCIFC